MLLRLKGWLKQVFGSASCNQGRSDSRRGTARLELIELEDRTMPSAAITFSLGNTFPTGAFPKSVAVGDLTGDGRLDLAVANPGSDDVSILRGVGDGTFTPFSTPFVGIGFAPYSVAVSDFNGDGALDLAVANIGSNNVSVLNGANGFLDFPGSPVAVGQVPVAVAVGNFNGNVDLIPDLAVVNQADGTVSILQGDGLGGFADFAGSPYAVGLYPNAVAVGDFNGDGNPDLVVANSGSSNANVLLGDGFGGFTAFLPPAPAGYFPVAVAVGDFNGDGRLDLAFASSSVLDNVIVLRGDGTGDFSAFAGSPITVGAYPSSIAAGDFNGDGNLDLVTVSSNYNNSLTILQGAGDGTFTQTTIPAVGTNPSSVAVGDFNGDGKPDLAVANFSDNQVRVLLNTTPFPSPDNPFIRELLASQQFSQGSHNSTSSANSGGAADRGGAGAGLFGGSTPTSVSPLGNSVLTAGNSPGGEFTIQVASLQPGGSESVSTYSMGGIQGQISGEQVAGVTVYLSLANAGGAQVVVAQTTTDADGVFIFRNVPSGRYEISTPQRVGALDREGFENDSAGSAGVDFPGSAGVPPAEFGSDSVRGFTSPARGNPWEDLSEIIAKSALLDPRGERLTDPWLPTDFKDWDQGWIAFLRGTPVDAPGVAYLKGTPISPEEEMRSRLSLGEKDALEESDPLLPGLLAAGALAGVMSRGRADRNSEVKKRSCGTP